MRIKKIILACGFTTLLIGAITLSGCNSGGNVGNVTDKENNLSESANSTIAPFDGQTGYDSIHQRTALKSCFKIPTTWYVADNKVNVVAYYYALNEKSLMNQTKTAETFKFHDTDHMLLSKTSLSGHYVIENSLEKTWDMYGINLFGIGVQGYTVGFTINMSSLDTIINSQGTDTLQRGASLYPNDMTKQYEYFVVQCGDSLPDSWGYNQFVVSHMTVENNTDEEEDNLNKKLSLSGNEGTGILPVGIDGTNSVDYDMHDFFKSNIGSMIYHFEIFGTGNVSTTVPEICDSTSQQNCYEQFVRPFFGTVSNWKQANPRTQMSSSLRNEPYPGSQYLPASVWNGKFHTKSIKSLIVTHLQNANESAVVKIPTRISHPKMFVYADTIYRIDTMYNKATAMLSILNNLAINNYQYCNLFSNANENLHCIQLIQNAETSLNTFINSIDTANNNQTGKLFTYCYDGFYRGANHHGDPDSPKCIQTLNNYYNSENLPYGTLLKLQDQSQIAKVSRTESAVTIGSLTYIDQGKNSQNDRRIYKFSKGDTKASFWGGNQLTPQYLVAEGGDYVATFTDLINNPYNIYVANGLTSNSLYVIPGAYSTPLQTQNLKVFRANKSILNIDGNFEFGGDVRIYENLNLAPGNYIYARCDSSVSECPEHLRGYLLIVDNNYNLYEYAVYYGDYNLYQIWSTVNNNINLSEKATTFNSSTGIFGIYDVSRQSASSNSYIYNPYNSINDAPTDGIRRYALELNSVNGALSIYKYNSNLDNSDDSVWSNLKSLKSPVLTTKSYPNVGNGSFWYRYQTESSESAE